LGAQLYMRQVKGFKAMREREEIEVGFTQPNSSFLLCTVGNLTVLILLQLLSFESFDEIATEISREENK
jgi:hypothetical protein